MADLADDLAANLDGYDPEDKVSAVDAGNFMLAQLDGFEAAYMKAMQPLAEALAKEQPKAADAAKAAIAALSMLGLLGPSRR